MIQKEFSFTEFGFSSQLIRDLVTSKPEVEKFIGDFFSLENIIKQANNKGFSAHSREQLVTALKLQNDEIKLSDKTKANIEALSDQKTMTITTGHQLNLMTGPLYSIYKVAQVISLSEEMNKKDVDHKYVPVFWMATEDHDFEEINHINLFNKKIVWDKVGQEKHIVGEIKPKGIDSFTDQIAEKYQDEELKEVLRTFTDVYKDSQDLATATRMIMNRLFSDYGLVIIDGNDASLKSTFSAIAKKEVQEGVVFDAVSKANKDLEELGYHSQVFVRNCNLFQITSAGKRQRIAKENGIFSIEGEIISKEELLKDIDLNPKAYSPNALLRPVYQELILPNVAYIGGGGEIAYWLQLKGVFEALDLTFPLLRVRDSVLLLREREIADLEELPFTIPELKQNSHTLIKQIALNDVAVEIELNKELDELREIKTKVLTKGETVNKGLAGMIEAEFVKMEKAIERIESKLVKGEKAKHDKKAKKIEKLQAKIYPSGGFQERYENVLPYYLNNSQFVSKIIDNIPAEDIPLIRVVEI